MVITRRRHFWRSAVLVLWFAALVLLIGHVAMGHHDDGKQQDCPLCLAALGMAPVIAAVLPSVCLICLGFVHCRCLIADSAISISTPGRSPPADFLRSPAH